MHREEYNSTKRCNRPIYIYIYILYIYIIYIYRVLALVNCEHRLIHYIEASSLVCVVCVCFWHAFLNSTFSARYVSPTPLCMPRLLMKGGDHTDYCMYILFDLTECSHNV